ncbi:MAG: hypothetical protein HQ556_13540 [Candidatus Marinimicrobia bacterium]|nr:hypothetical protein [Candidatus Neomarinimicrobiota bacterium]
METYTHIETDQQPDQIRTQVIEYVREHYSSIQMLSRIPVSSLTKTFLGNYLDHLDSIGIHMPSKDSSVYDLLHVMGEAQDEFIEQLLKFVEIHYSKAQVLVRLPRTITRVFMGDYLQNTHQSLTRIQGDTDTVIIRNIQ